MIAWAPRANGVQLPDGRMGDEHSGWHKAVRAALDYLCSGASPAELRTLASLGGYDADNA